jgi:DNA-binding PadR family transcriptional regulator
MTGIAHRIDEQLPLRPVIFEMLLILNEGERHGYGIMQDLKERSAGRWILGPGTLYRTINEMLDKDLIAPGNEKKEQTAGKKRLYYRITDFGKKVASAEAGRMASLVRTATEGKLI